MPPRVGESIRLLKKTDGEEITLIVTQVLHRIKYSGDRCFWSYDVEVNDPFIEVSSKSSKSKKKGK
jgi:hypothetical protein